MNRLAAINAIAFALRTFRALVTANAAQWISCVRNKTTGLRGWAMAARYVDLGTSVPFRPTHASQFPNPKFQVSAKAKVGECLIPDQIMKDMMN